MSGKKEGGKEMCKVEWNGKERRGGSGSGVFEEFYIYIDPDSIRFGSIINLTGGLGRYGSPFCSVRFSIAQHSIA